MQVRLAGNFMMSSYEFRQQQLERIEAHRKERFRKALNAGHYRAALIITEHLEYPLVCYVCTAYIDNLLDKKLIDKAKKIARLFGRNLDCYLEFEIQRRGMAQG